MRFNDIIRHALKDTGTTQAQLGERLGVRQNAISNTLQRPETMLGTFVSIMNALGYDVAVIPRDKSAEPITITNEPESHL